MPPINIVSARLLQPSSKQWMAARGIAVHDYELIRIAYLSDFAAVLQDNPNPFVFTSVHGVKAVAAVARERQINLYARGAYCIEGATSAQAQAEGFSVLAQDVSGELLAQKIVKNRVQEVLYCAATVRREALENILHNAGIGTRIVEVYAKQSVPQRVVEFDALMLFSPSQVDSFLAVNTIERQPVFCIGPTTAGHFAAMCPAAPRAIIAAMPSEQVLAEAVCRHFQTLSS